VFFGILRDKLDIVVSVVGLALLGYLFGVYSADKKLVTYPKFLEQILTEAEQNLSRDAGVWHPVEARKSGVVTNRDGAVNGLTLINSAHRPGARLIDLNGRTVHRWEKSFGEVWADSPFKSEANDGSIYWRDVHLFPDGQVLAVYESKKAVPHGRGLVKLSEDSRVLWKIPRKIHHQLEVDDNGTIWALSQQMRDTGRRPIPNNSQLSREKSNEVVEERILQISPDGDIKATISIIDALVGSTFNGILQGFPLKEHLKLYGAKPWAPVHATAIEVVNDEMARKVGALERGDLLVSIRSLGVVVGIDPQRRSVVWASRGIWTGQHDIDVLTDGHLAVFDNLGHAGAGDRSRILKINPSSNRVVWRYTGTSEAPLFSSTEGAQQRLSGGHMLITETNGGRIFEVGPSGQILWTYHNPKTRRKQGQRQVSELFNARRYDADSLSFIDSSGRE
jgi:hypothetical protein